MVTSVDVMSPHQFTDINNNHANVQSKRAKRRQRQKQARQQLRAQEANGLTSMVDENDNDNVNVKHDPDADGPIVDNNDNVDNVEVLYIPEKIAPDEPLAEHFIEVLERFAARGISREEPEVEVVPTKEESDQSESDEETEEANISQRQLKKLNRMTVPELKQASSFPEVVDVHDVCSPDPILLVQLKVIRNSVPVPIHWSQKRKYLQGKRGMEKVAFKLPDFIAATGIAQIRQAMAEQDKEKKLKAKQRERMQPKMNRIDIDYQVLHDAFFRNQPKAVPAVHGDIYYEGKEFQVNVKTARPGVFSQALKEALGMREGYPPPWLINMQRFGPPPSYRHLKIPGLNAPLPPGAMYGYGEGQWGKPPVDHLGHPLYGDPFGVAPEDDFEPTPIPNPEPWGEIVEEEEEVEYQPEQEEEEVEMEEEDDEIESGIESVQSYASGLVTPDQIEIRKGFMGQETPEVDLRKRELYQVLESKDMAVGNALYGSSHTYRIPTTATSGSAVVAGQLSDGQVQVSLAPEELANLDEAALARRYQEQLEAVKALRSTDDVSDVVLEETRKRQRKEEAKTKSKKFKDFKF